MSLKRQGKEGRLASINLLNDDTIALAMLSVNTGCLEAGVLKKEEALSLITGFNPGEVLIQIRSKRGSSCGTTKTFLSSKEQKSSLPLTGLPAGCARSLMFLLYRFLASKKGLLIQGVRERFFITLKKPSLGLYSM